MKIIKAVEINGQIVPESPLPKGEDVKMIVCNGSEYVIYEEGDQLPDLGQQE